ncbi:hypothetical protein OPAG_01476 [Rhodococcus opacus PD630]|nr:hypothetical protein Pd630_LPD07124 [Rhodococcus opacus PD630]EHI39780.1 hypothetical protein OPAG_01476 [Rhodococcus opacus PD630]
MACVDLGADFLAVVSDYENGARLFDGVASATPIWRFSSALRVSCPMTPDAGYADVPTAFMSRSCPDSEFLRCSRAEICASAIGLNVPHPDSGVSHASTTLSRI